MSVATVSISDLAYRLRDAVQSTLRKRSAFGIAQPGISLVPAPGPLIGIVLKERDFSASKISDFTDLARDLLQQMPDYASKGEAAVMILDRRVIVGFVPSPNLLEFKE
jgi:hypothetical protein